MKNKAQINWVFLSAIIAVVLLLIIFLGPMKGFDKIQNYFDNTPGFNDTSKEPMKIGIVRYDIEMDKVQLYDGERWNDLTTNTKFDGLKKETTESEMNQIFEDYYFDKSKRNSAEIFNNGEYNVKVTEIAKSKSLEPEKPSWYNVGGWIGYGIGQWTLNTAPVYSRGTVIAFVSKGKSEYGILFFNGNNNGEFYGVVQSSSDSAPVNPFNEVQSIVINQNATIWRDSVFKNPAITVQGTQFCLKKVGTSYLSEGRYLLVDLNKAGEKCNA
ncbi:MAG TPA: hypothetical protein VHA12_00625 [Candidatus Nanoarchaeia archaeon]|nr:hypothetical protein [Candidatus Nanoarchaeia archaeon]